MNRRRKKEEDFFEARATYTGFESGIYHEGHDEIISSAFLEMNEFKVSRWGKETTKK